MPKAKEETEMTTIYKENINGKYEMKVLKSFIKSNLKEVERVFEARFVGTYGRSFYSERGDIENQYDYTNKYEDNCYFICYRKCRKRVEYKVYLWFGYAFIKRLVEECKKEMEENV